MSEQITGPDMEAAPEWAWMLADKIVLGNQGVGNASVLIHRAFADRIASHTKALVDGAGDLAERLFKRTIITYCEDGSTIGYEPPAIQQEAAATIAALKAELAQAKQREAQARIEGVRAGINASAGIVERQSDYTTVTPFVQRDRLLAEVRALDPAAIAKGV